ncbi:MAG: ATP-binding protein [Dehalococcoidia bacterium]
MRCSLSNGVVEVIGAGVTKEAAGQAVGWARQLLPMAEREDPKRVPIIFWMGDREGVSNLRRTLDVPRWPDIAANYALATRTALDGLMTGFVPAKGGQLLLFHGLAGTGKTFALRAIAAEWRTWCDVDYVIDPDRFLGEGKYLISVLLARRAEWGDEFGMPSFLRRMTRGYGATEDDETNERWRLIVMEDTGELLSVDAKERTGQSLSRLLNTVDGLIGQGLRTLILVTTNEPIRELHPAVARAGRCAAAIEFLPLSAGESTAWLSREVSGATTIADLYALREGYRSPPLELPDEAGVRTHGPA